MQIAPMSEDRLEQVVSAWNLALPHDQLSQERFRRVMLEDPNYEPEGVLVAEAEDGTVLGFSACVVRRTVRGRDGSGSDWAFKQGFLKGFFVIECDCQGEVAERLLAAAESYCRAAGKAELRVTEYAGPYVFPGVDLRYHCLYELLVRRGYRDVSTVVDAEAALDDPELPLRLASARRRVGAEVALLEWRPELLPAMQRFVAAGDQPQWFPPGWESRFAQPEDRALVLQRGEEIVGWAQYGQGKPKAGFGPIMVLERDRGRGYGSLLLVACMARAREGGATAMTAGWANIGFYVANGWHITRRYAVLTKRLSKESESI